MNSRNAKQVKRKWFVWSLVLFMVCVFAIPAQAAEEWSALGNEGGEPGQFKFPDGVAVDRDGNVYVADTSNHRIQKQTASTGEWSFWGKSDNSAGFNEGEFNSPKGVAVDGRGNVYVLDDNYGHIRKLNVDTNQWEKLYPTMGLSAPGGVAVDSLGNVYVTDWTMNRILKLTVETGQWTLLGGTAGYGSGLGQFKAAFGVAVDSQNNVYVADSQNNRIQKQAAGTQTWVVWAGGTIGSLPGQFYNPFGVAVDSHDNVYVTDQYNYRIQKKDAVTQQWSVLAGGYGNGPGHFNTPNGVAVDSRDNVYVSDTNNHRIQKLTKLVAPDAPTGVTATAGNEQATVSFTLPAYNGGREITGYKVTANPDAFTETGQITATGTDSPIVVTGLTNGTTYSFTVVATNSQGDSVASAPASATPQVPAPGAPVLQSTAGDGQATLKWNLVNGATGYKIFQSNAPGTYGAELNTVSGSVYSYSATGLTNGTPYYFTVKAVNAGGDSPASNEVSATPQVPAPGAPVLHSATAGNGQATLTWNLVNGATGYRVFQSNTPGTYGAELGSVSGSVYSYSATGLTNGTTYYFTVKATNAGGDSPASNEVSATPQVPAPGAPILQSATAGDGQATLTWSSINGANSYKVFQSQIPGTYGAELNTVGGSESSYSATGLTNGTTYYFTVKAINAGGESAASNELSATPQVPAPGAPVLQSAVASNGQVTLAWNPVNGSTGYKVFQSNSSGTYGAEINTVSGAVYSYSATGLTNGTTYYFVVTAINAGGESAASNEVSAMPQVPAPGAPVVQSLAAGDGQATLTWNPVSGATGYKVFQSKTAGTYGAELNTVSGSVYSYNATGLTNDTAYYFVVKAINAGGDSSASNEVSATPQVPAPGASVIESATAGNGQATLTWSPVNGAIGYKVFQSNTSGTYGTEISTVSGAVYSYSATGLTNGIAYYFVVKAINAGGESAASNEVSATPRTVPGTPTGVTAVASNGQATITFTAPADNGGSLITGFEVISSPGNIVVTGTASPITVTGLSNGVTYKFTVKAINSVGSGAWSAASTEVTPRSSTDSGGNNGNNGNNGGGSGGSGGGPASSSDSTVTSTDGKLTIPVGSGGKASLGDTVTIVIPAYATSKELKIAIEKLLDYQKLLTDKAVLASPVFEILKNLTENFNKPVTLTFMFDPTVLKGSQQPVVFYYDEAKQVWVEVEGGKIQGSTISVDVDHFTKFAVFAVDPEAAVKVPETKPAISFSDIAGHWAEANIKQAVSEGIVTGYPDSTFKPGKAVTRAEFAVMLMNTLKPQGEGKALTFTDKANIGTWAQKAVAQAVQAGIIQGYEDNTFRADAEMTRAEMSTMIAKALGLTIEANAATGFADEKDIPEWAKGTVAANKKLGMLEGKDLNKFDPNAKTVRAEAVTVLLKLRAHQSK
ncbi:fibronectin type III domain-containing protein [Paenibacillus hodogayensis]|uniref:Fibronectin type III domain-containing protein n=1 Tax=Paenibacillus hodogayensis TaxID=279208 RepID=A0ABV5VS99_9BACL